MYKISLKLLKHPTDTNIYTTLLFTIYSRQLQASNVHQVVPHRVYVHLLNILSRLKSWYQIISAGCS